jgi:hypothetical protein
MMMNSRDFWEDEAAERHKVIMNTCLPAGSLGCMPWLPRAHPCWFGVAMTKLAASGVEYPEWCLTRRGCRGVGPARHQ